MHTRDILTRTAIGIVQGYIDAQGFGHNADALRAIRRDTQNVVNGIRHAANALGVKLPTWEQLYCLAQAERGRRDADANATANATCKLATGVR